MRLSKTGKYEKPYTITGSIKQAGSKEKPKGIYVKIEISEQGKLAIWRA